MSSNVTWSPLFLETVKRDAEMEMIIRSWALDGYECSHLHLCHLYDVGLDNLNFLRLVSFDLANC